MLFEATTFGMLLSQIWRASFTLRSWRTFLVLAQGWALSGVSHTIAEYIWLSGGVKFRHFSRYYAFLSKRFWPMGTQLWMQFYRWLDHWLAEELELVILVDDTTRKKSGAKIQGVGNYHNHAGSARQEYRFLRGLNFVYLSLRLSWRGYRLTLPLGCEVYLKKEEAKRLARPFHSRSTLARRRLAMICEAMPKRRILLCCDGGYANRDMLKELPEQVQVVTRLLVSAGIHEPPCPVAVIGKRGRRPQKGWKLPPPKDWPEYYQDWQPHPTEAGALIRTAVIRWPKSYPGRSIRVVAVWRPKLKDSKHPRDQKRYIEAFISTNLHHTPGEILEIYQDRWAVEIDIRDAYTYYGLGKDRCRKLINIEAVNNLRMLLAAARTIWFMITYQNATLDLQHLRPWYTHKFHPSQADIDIALKEALAQEKIKPIPRFQLPKAIIRKQWRSFYRKAA